MEGNSRFMVLWWSFCKSYAWISPLNNAKMLNVIQLDTIFNLSAFKSKGQTEKGSLIPAAVHQHLTLSVQNPCTTVLLSNDGRQICSAVHEKEIILQFAPTGFQLNGFSYSFSWGKKWCISNHRFLWWVALVFWLWSQLGFRHEV